MAAKRVRSCAIYVRISIATEESVSIDRQLDSARAYAAARGWLVLGEFVDEGVSATHNKPEDRDGWRSLLAAQERRPADAVIVWKVDRLARRVLDFMNANEALKKTGAGLVAVEDPIDMTTPQGEAFATMLAVFAQLEADTIRARVLAAREHLLHAGRYTGGQLPYGYLKQKNPNGAGYVVVHDPDAIGWVRQMVERTQAGHTIYSTVQWLNEQNAPTPSVLKAARREDGELDWRGLPKKPVKVQATWGYNTVDRLLRHPLLAGMTLHNPEERLAKGKWKRRGSDVLRGPDGLRVIDHALAIMPASQWDAMQADLANRDHPAAKPVALKRKHSGLLSGLMWCSAHPEPVRMRRNVVGVKGAPRMAYRCPDCGRSMSDFEHIVIDEFLATAGPHTALTVMQEVLEGGAYELHEASIRLGELGAEMVNAGPDRALEIITEMQRLKDVQAEAKNRPAVVRDVQVGTPQPFASAWADAEDDADRARLLRMALRRVLVAPGRAGVRGDAAKRARMTFDWTLGQTGHPGDDVLAAWAAEDLT